MRLHITLFCSFLLAASTFAQNPACDSVTIESIKFDGLRDSVVTIRVNNASSELFDYPKFILTNATSGDTVAIETPNFFGIFGPSTHAMAIQPPGASNGPFVGQLDLYSGGGDSLRCTFTRPVQLCPVTGCNYLYISVQSFGPQATADLAWNVIDTSGQSLGSGLIGADGSTAPPKDSICLEHGTYTLTLTESQPFAGFLYYHIETECQTAFPLEGGYQLGGQTFNVEMMPQCAGFVQAVPEAVKPNRSLALTMDYGTLQVRSLNSQPIGPVSIYALDGRLVASSIIPGTQGSIDLSAQPSGLYLLLQPTATGSRAQKFLR